MTRIIFEEKGARPLEAYFEDSKRLGVADFARQHGMAFLVHHGPVPPTKISSGWGEAKTTTW